MTDWPTEPETCMAYQDDDDEATRCIRQRGHESSHLTSRGACWPNTAKPHKPRYIGPRTSFTTIVHPRIADRDAWRGIL